MHKSYVESTPEGFNIIALSPLEIQSIYYALIRAIIAHDIIAIPGPILNALKSLSTKIETEYPEIKKDFMEMVITLPLNNEALHESVNFSFRNPSLWRMLAESSRLGPTILPDPDPVPIPPQNETLL